MTTNESNKLEATRDFLLTQIQSKNCTSQEALNYAQAYELLVKVEGQDRVTQNRLTGTGGYANSEEFPDEIG